MRSTFFARDYFALAGLCVVLWSWASCFTGRHHLNQCVVVVVVILRETCYGSHHHRGWCGWIYCNPSDCVFCVASSPRKTCSLSDQIYIYICLETYKLHTLYPMALSLSSAVSSFFLFPIIWSRSSPFARHPVRCTLRRCTKRNLSMYICATFYTAQ